MQMQDQIIVVVFPSRRILAKALDHLLDEVAVEVTQAAVVVKSKTGRVRVLSDALGGGEGGLIGAAAGILVGAAGTLVFGVAGWLWLAVGAVLGSLVGWLIGQVVTHLVDFSFAKPYTKGVADELQSGHSALMLHVEDAAELLPKLKDELKPYRAEIVERLRELQANLPRR